MVSMEPDGAVRALVGGMDYDDSQFNRATHARRQPGSSFKLYVYATAFENGYNPSSIVRDCGGACGNWAPKNYTGGGSGGRMTAIDAFQSRSTCRGRAVARVGREKVLEMTQRLGVGRRQEDLLDGAGRHRHHAAAAHRRLRHVRQRRHDAKPTPSWRLQTPRAT